jgi:hypothetical protein
MRGLTHSIMPVLGGLAPLSSLGVLTILNFRELDTQKGEGLLLQQQFNNKYAQAHLTDSIHFADGP